MGNKEYLRILKQGVEVWNPWRRADLDLLPDLSKAHLSGAILVLANPRKANLTEANLRRGHLLWTKLQKATLISCSIYGISAWDLKLDAKTQQQDPVITPPDQPSITVDNL